MKLRTYLKRYLLLFTFLLIGTFVYSAQLYWIGGSGNWSNPANWSTSTGGSSGSVLPTANDNVVFDLNSGLSNGNNINIPAGEFSVKDFIVTGTPASFNFRFSSTTTATTMNVYGKLRFLSTHNVTYANSSLIHEWVFHGASGGSQEIKTYSKNLKSVRFPNDNEEYDLLTDLVASIKIIYVGGNLTTNNFNTSTQEFTILNNGAVSNSLKEFNAGTSVINCTEFTSLFAYSALSMIGEFTIKAEKFRGNVSDPNSGFTNYLNKIILKDRVPTGNFQDYNFECFDCIIDSLVIENTHDTYISKSVIIQELFDLEAPGKTIIFESGTNLDNQISIEGDVHFPSSGSCSNVTQFKNENDFTLFHRTSGSLQIDDAVLLNIHTSGGANFTATDCQLLESSTGWNINSTNTPKTYYWKGNSGNNIYWGNLNNWEFAGGSTPSCLPKSIDNVIIDNNSINGIRIDPSTLATCNNFTWTKTSTVSLILEGTNDIDAKLYIHGNMDVHASANIDGSSDFNHYIVFSPTSNATLETNGVHFPDVIFSGNTSDSKLLDDFSCDDLLFKSGTLLTANKGLSASSFTGNDAIDKTLNLGSSHLMIDGPFDIKSVFTTVLAGTSLIECTDLFFEFEVLHNIQLNNASTTYLSNGSLSLNKLTLNGTGEVNVHTLTVDSLIFTQSGTSFLVEWAYDLIINEVLSTQAIESNPTTIKTDQNGFTADLNHGESNFCWDGYFYIQDIDVVSSAVIHAPKSIDGGNNTNIDFTSSAALSPLYWIGNSGVWDTQTNWSNKSGGCPVIKNPNTAQRLIFDDNSFMTDNEVVTLPILTNCKILDFRNQNHPATFDIQTRVNPTQVLIDNAVVNLNGSRIYVHVQTIIENGGVLTLDLTELELPKFDTPILEIDGNSAVNVNGNSQLIIR